MLSEPDDRPPPTPLERFFTALFHRNSAGAGWLPALLQATPHGPERLGELAERPGWLQTQLAVPAQSGRLACFEYPVAAPRELEAWWIDHPTELTWPPTAEHHGSSEAIRLRRALLDDDPPGSRSRAQERAREMLRARSALAQEWWRFEEVELLECTLITERLVVVVSTAPCEPATPWYPRRSRLVRDLEGARHLAIEGKPYAVLALGDDPAPDGEALQASLPIAAPHLRPDERDEVAGAYLGALTWAAAAGAVGLDLPRL